MKERTKQALATAGIAASGILAIGSLFVGYEYHIKNTAEITATYLPNNKTKEFKEEFKPEKSGDLYSGSCQINLVMPYPSTYIGITTLDLPNLIENTKGSHQDKVVGPQIQRIVNLCATAAKESYNNAYGKWFSSPRNRHVIRKETSRSANMNISTDEEAKNLIQGLNATMIRR